LKIEGDWCKMQDEYFIAPLEDEYGYLIDEDGEPMEEWWALVDERREFIEEWWKNRVSAAIQIPEFVAPPAKEPLTSRIRTSHCK